MVRWLREKLFPPPEEPERRKEEDRRRLSAKEGQTSQPEIATFADFPQASGPIELASAACPYCGVVQDPPPQRRKKCRDCGEVIHTRTDRVERKRYLLTADEAERRKREWRETGQGYVQHSLERHRELGLSRSRIRTAEDERVCDECRALNNVVVAITEDLDHMPLPARCTNPDGCRCVYIPVIPGVNDD